MLTRRYLLVAVLGLVVIAGTSASAAVIDAIRGSQQWVFGMLSVSQAWQQSNGNGVTVAVLDSGVNPRVSDLRGSVISGPDLTGLRTAPANAGWGVHGTWMASIIAAHGHDGGGSGVVGVAPAARILSIRVIPDHGDPGYQAYEREPEAKIQRSLAAGILTAVRDGAQVISMSIGYDSPSAPVRAALGVAYARGVVVLASSGNAGPGRKGFAPASFPASYPGVISVGAVGQSGTVEGFSSDNLSVQVAAPGENVPAQGRDGQYWLVSGTSPACALVAGVAALIKSRYPGLPPESVDKALITTTNSRPHGGYDAKIGFGTVDARAALAAAGRLVSVDGRVLDGRRGDAPLGDAQLGGGWFGGGPRDAGLAGFGAGGLGGGRVVSGRRPGPAGVAVTSRFGGGPAAVPAAPVSSRGTGPLVSFSVLALLSLLLALLAGRMLAGRRAGRGLAGRGLAVSRRTGDDGRGG